MAYGPTLKKRRRGRDEGFRVHREASPSTVFRRLRLPCSSPLVVMATAGPLRGFGLAARPAKFRGYPQGDLEDAQQNIVTATLYGNTSIPRRGHSDCRPRFCSSPHRHAPALSPAAPVRAVAEAAGIKNIRAKCLRTSNPANVVAATMEGLQPLRDASMVGGSAVSGKTAGRSPGLKGDVRQRLRISRK